MKPLNTTNTTLQKFGDPETRIKKFERWIVVLRPVQVTLGSMVLVCTEPVTQFSLVSREAFAELHLAIGQIEQCLKQAFAYDKINYLMLMMVDPDVHFHILPRYARPQQFSGQEFVDSSWPGPPNLADVNRTNQEVNASILEFLKNHWPNHSPASESAHM